MNVCDTMCHVDKPMLMLKQKKVTGRTQICRHRRTDRWTDKLIPVYLPDLHSQGVKLLFHKLFHNSLLKENSNLHVCVTFLHLDSILVVYSLKNAISLKEDFTFRVKMVLID